MVARAPVACERVPQSAAARKRHGALKMLKLSTL